MWPTCIALTDGCTLFQNSHFFVSNKKLKH